MIDLHSHILWGLDDGAATPAESLEIARSAVAGGITAIAATPHVRDDYPTDAQTMEARVEELRSELERARVPLDLLPGGEIAADRLPSLSEDELRRFGLGGNPRYLLLETPYSGWPVSLVDGVRSLLAQRIVPVLAHPERNPEVQARPSRLATLVRSGALVQVTGASLDGRIGRRAQACGRQLIADGLAHLVASDAHHASVRAAGLTSAIRAVGDDALAEWLTWTVPDAIVRDAEVPARPPPRRKSGLVRRLFEV